MAELIQCIQPDVLLLNEFNCNESGEAARLFQEDLFDVPRNVSDSPEPAEPISFPYVFVAHLHKKKVLTKAAHKSVEVTALCGFVGTNADPLSVLFGSQIRLTHGGHRSNSSD